MRTIAFIDPGEEELWDSFQRYGLLFDQVQGKGDFAVCPWDRSGTSVARAIPRLPQILEDLVEADGNEGWQAIVVTDLRQSEGALSRDRHFDNPFDFPDSYDTGYGAPLRESPHAIVRLAQMLGGIPDRVHLEWSSSPDASSKDDGLGRIIYANPEGDFEFLGRYRLGLPRPIRVLCVTPRDADEGFYELREREIRREVEEDGGATRPHSRIATTGPGFCERNGYPASARFIVCDRERLMRRPGEEDLAPGEEAPDLDYLEDQAWLRLWLGVWALASQPVDAWDLQGDSLLRMRVDVDRRRLVSTVRDTYERWGRARNAVAHQIERESARLVASEREVHDLPDIDVSIQVPFDSRPPGELFASPRPLGLFKDLPKDDLATWRRERDHSGAAYRSLLKAPRRSTRLACANFRASRAIPDEDLEYCVINATEREELDERLEGLETRLARGVGERLFEGTRPRVGTERASKAIEDAIEVRPRSSQGLGALGISAAALFVGLTALAAVGMLTSAVALYVALAASGVVAAASLVSAFGMRGDVEAAYEDYNESVKGDFDALAKEARTLGARLSAYATFRRGWSVRQRQCHLERPTRRMDSLERMMARLERRMGELEVLAESSAISLPVPSDDPALVEPWSELSGYLRGDSYYDFVPEGRGPMRRATGRRGRAAGLGFVASLAFERLKVL